MAAKSQKQFEQDAPRPRIETVATAEIRSDQLVQARERLDPGKIAEYVDAMIDGSEFPPVVVVDIDGGGYLLVDGYLRLAAAKLAKRKTLQCEVHRGDLRAAVLLSCEVNARHGLPRTNADRRRAVGKLLRDEEWSKWSDREIARRCSVSPGFVSQVRGPLTVQKRSERKYLTKHGTVATMNVNAIGKPPAAVEATLVPANPETSGEVVSLSGFTQNYREQFVAALRQAEEIFVGLPPISVIRGDPTADIVLAQRLTALAQKATQIAEHLRRDRQAS